MVVGMERGKSVAQNIDALFFSPMGKLHYEYGELYKSLLITPFGIKQNMYRHSVQNVVTAKDLFITKYW